MQGGDALGGRPVPEDGDRGIARHDTDDQEDEGEDGEQRRDRREQAADDVEDHPRFT